MNANKVARFLTVLAVLAVAVIAAIVSYTHIESLALANGYTIDTARLLPFSVDGLLVASSLSLASGGRPWLARTGLVLGVLATVAANVMFGLAAHGLMGAIVAAWPAIAFLVSSEILVDLVRGKRAAAPVAVETVTEPAEPVNATVIDSVTRGGIPAATEPPSRLEAATFVTRLSDLPAADESRPGDVPETSPVTAPAATVRTTFVAPVITPANAESAARAAMRASYLAGHPRSVNSLQVGFGITRSKATKIHREVLEADGVDVLVAASADDN